MRYIDKTTAYSFLTMAPYCLSPEYPNYVSRITHNSKYDIIHFTTSDPDRLLAYRKTIDQAIDPFIRFRTYQELLASPDVQKYLINNTTLHSDNSKIRDDFFLDDDTYHDPNGRRARWGALLKDCFLELFIPYLCEEVDEEMKRFVIRDHSLLDKARLDPAKNLNGAKEAVQYLAITIRNFLRREFDIEPPVEVSLDTMMMTVEEKNDEGEIELVRKLNPNFPRQDTPVSQAFRIAQAQLLAWIEAKQAVLMAEKAKHAAMPEAEQYEQPWYKLLDEVYGFSDETLDIDYNYHEIGQHFFDKLQFLEANLHGAVMKGIPGAEADLQELYALIGAKTPEQQADLTDTFFDHLTHDRSQLKLLTEDFTVEPVQHEEEPEPAPAAPSIPDEAIQAMRLRLFLVALSKNPDTKALAEDLSKFRELDNLSAFLNFANGKRPPEPVKKALALLKDGPLENGADLTPAYHKAVGRCYIEAFGALLAGETPRYRMKFPAFENNPASLQAAYAQFIAAIDAVHTTENSPLSTITRKDDGYYAGDVCLIKNTFSPQLIQMMRNLQQLGERSIVGLLYHATNAQGKKALLEALGKAEPSVAKPAPTPAPSAPAQSSAEESPSPPTPAANTPAPKKNPLKKLSDAWKRKTSKNKPEPIPTAPVTPAPSSSSEGEETPAAATPPSETPDDAALQTALEQQFMADLLNTALTVPKTELKANAKKLMEEIRYDGEHVGIVRGHQVHFTKNMVEEALKKGAAESLPGIAGRLPSLQQTLARLTDNSLDEARMRGLDRYRDLEKKRNTALTQNNYTPTTLSDLCKQQEAGSLPKGSNLKYGGIGIKMDLVGNTIVLSHVERDPAKIPAWKQVIKDGDVLEYVELNTAQLTELRNAHARFADAYNTLKDALTEQSSGKTRLDATRCTSEEALEAFGVLLRGNPGSRYTLKTNSMTEAQEFERHLINMKHGRGVHDDLAHFEQHQWRR
jgi:hypothetical protein